tara:strand:- start:358 stop:618 length:261 start_codon:yes stop_codon:yes gene_type:complete
MTITKLIKRYAECYFQAKDARIEKLTTYSGERAAIAERNEIQWANKLLEIVEQMHAVGYYELTLHEDFPEWTLTDIRVDTTKRPAA